MSISLFLYFYFKAFDKNPSLEIRSVFLDLSRVFDRVCPEGLPYKRKNSGIIESLFLNRRQRVVLNVQSSTSKFVKADAPLCLLLGTLFFLIYINVYHKDLYLMSSVLLMILPYFLLLTVQKLLLPYLTKIY